MTTIKAVVTGMIATYPVPGVAWDYIQYILGLQDLGFRVCYLEDTGQESYHQDPSGYLRKILSEFSPDQTLPWHYRSPEGVSFGLSNEELTAFVASADLFLNVSGACLLREAYMACKCKVLIDTDPGFNHFLNYPKWDSGPGWQGTYGYRGHDHFFTYAGLIGQPECLLPTLGLDWKRTLPPVVLDRWDAKPSSGGAWTTIMSWRTYSNFPSAITTGGLVLAAKEAEFVRFQDLPQFTHARLEVAVAGNGIPHELWRSKGWSTVLADAVAGTTQGYKEYIERSKGEFSVAKHIYVASRSGWFSCRSTCYLASSRPIIVQDTGFSRLITTGNGILAFSSIDEAVDALDQVESDYSHHQEAALDHARSTFSSERVLSTLLSDIGL